MNNLTPYNLIAGTDATRYPYSSGAEGTGKVRTVSVEIPECDIETKRKEQGVTISNYILHSIMQVLKSITREERVLITAVNNGRSHSCLQNLQGFFVRMLPVLSEETSCDLQRQFIDTIIHEEYSLTEIVESTGIHPEILYAYEGELFSDNVQNKDVESISLSLDTPKMPICIIVNPTHNDRYIMTIEYDDSLYTETDMQIFADCVKTMATHGRLVTEEEEQRLISLGTGECLDYDMSQTFVDLFREQVEKTPDNIAVADRDSSITYMNLDAESDAIAQWLIEEYGVGQNDFVAVMLPRRKEFVISVIGIWKSGAAYVPVDPEYPEERKRFMIEDSEAKVVLTPELLHDRTFPVQSQSINLSTPDGLAYMIYTSGSTGKPKGVMISHSAYTNDFNFYVRQQKLSALDRMGSHRNFCFDASLEDLFPILSVGGTLDIMPEEIRMDIPAIKEYIDCRGINCISFTTSLGSLILQEYPDIHLRFMGVGGEKLQPVDDLRIPLRNFYGPTECTITCVTALIEPFRKYIEVPIGKTVANSTALVLDKDGKMLPEGVEGELYISGPQLSVGYWHNPELTSEKFVDCPYLKGQKMYKTGDLVRWNDDGLLEYIGRIDNQVKLRGFRIELGEIESVCSKIAGVRQSVALVRKDLLCLYYVGDVQESVIRDELSRSLADYMVPSVFVRMEAMPFTPNGKLDHKALPEPMIEETETVLPATVTERDIYDIVSEALKTEHFGVTTNLVSIGMSSIAAMRISLKLQQHFGSEIRMTDLMFHPTIRDLSSIVSSLSGDGSLYGIKHPVRDYYPLTPNQLGIYIDWDRHRGDLQYNVPSALKIHSMDAEKLATAIVRVIDAHPILKMRLVDVDGEINQLRDDARKAEVMLSPLPDDASIKSFLQSRVRLFDLFNDNLYRFEIYTSNSDIYLFSDIHHIVTDGLSQGLLIEEIFDVYEGKEIEKEGYTFYDYALESKSSEKDDNYNENRKYFDNLIAGTDATRYPYSSGAEGTGKVRTVSVEIPECDIETKRKEQGVTVSNYILHSIMQVLKSITREERVLITAVNNGRSHSCLQNLQGFFVRTLPVLSEETPRDLQRQFIETIIHEEYSLTEIVESTGIHPEILYAYEGELFTRKLQDYDVKSVSLNLDTPKMPVCITVCPTGDGMYILRIEYDDSLYTDTDMQIFADCIKTMAT